MENTSIKPRLYIGKDIHKRSYQVTIRTEINEHKSMSMPPDPDALFEYVHKLFPQHDVHLTYEAGCCGFSSARYYLNLGWNVTIVNPADIPVSNKHAFQKTDKIDSRNLCKQLQLGTLKNIYIPTEAQEQFRSLLRHRLKLTRDLRRIKSQIKSSLLFHGIKIPTEYDNNHWTHNFRNWIASLEWSTPCGKSNMTRKLSDFEYIYTQYKDTANELRAYAKKSYPKEYDLLPTIPGIGGFIAAALLAEIGDFSRFSNETQFSSYLGVIPGIYNSGSKETNLGVTPRANHTLRPLLIEAVWVAVAKDPEIQHYYRSHIGKNPKTIVVKIAHKMARRILGEIKSGQPYRINYNQSLDPSLTLPTQAQDIIDNQEE